MNHDDVDINEYRVTYDNAAHGRGHPGIFPRVVICVDDGFDQLNTCTVVQNEDQLEIAVAELSSEGPVWSIPLSHVAFARHRLALEAR